MSFDQPRVFSATVLPPGEVPGDESRLETEQCFHDFILEFRIDGDFIYRDQLRENILVKQYLLSVDMAHVISYNEDLAHRLTNEPAELLPLFESAVRDVARRIVFPGSKTTLATGADDTQIQDDFSREVPACQVILTSNANPLPIRELDSSHISKLVRIPGIVIGASTLSSKATVLHLMCKSCQHVERLFIGGGFSGVQMPRACPAPAGPTGDKNCGVDPFIIVHEKCTFVDQQVLKLQEAPDMVPVGELPRHIILSADRNLTNKVVPGSRCTVMGIYSIYQSKASAKGTGKAVAIRNPYVRVVGLQVDVDHNSKASASFTDEEEEEFLALSRHPRLYEIFANSIAPSIYGNTDIKKAIGCLLMGGSKKILPDGMRLRGDINVLLLGDPGTAKSQLLKFVEKVAPIAIYTSGKGSSAAGLTASVQRDSTTRDFYLEGGAMVLADGGVVCIDEFDKMRDEDRVAIHEAMEQQTISIAKAGITTILNSRTSVLAAANPIFGRYDDMKTPGENIDFQTTILSRFDMIFIVKDDHNESRDQSIAKHVMNIHMNQNTAATAAQEQAGEIPIEKMRRYIAYCKARCAPRLSPEAAEKLSSHFVGIRKQVQQVEQDANERSSIPITVRQLEAIIRISESLAKLQLSPVAREEHVDEALRLFLASTMDAVGQGAGSRQELVEEVNKIEAELKRRLPIGWSTSYQTLVREFVTGKGYTQHALDKALMVMERRDSIQFRHQRANVYRSGV
ncbi:MCM2/3/5 family-domain-containing protein [Lipomyces starkeyi]